MRSWDDFDVDAAHARKEAHWYPDGPQWYRDEAGGWHFPGLDVSAEAEVKRPIRIEPLGEGFFVQELEPALGQVKRAFTDAFDLADWLLDWMGMGEAIIIDGPLHEMVETDRQRALDVARAAQEYVEVQPGRWCGEEYDSLAEAVKKWQGKGDDVLAGYTEEVAKAFE